MSICTQCTVFVSPGSGDSNCLSELRSSIAMVNLHLSVDGSQILLLSIPLSDIQRLSILPFKWLRFVMFSVCGARGNLFATPDGPQVNYDSTTESLADDYYYIPEGKASFVCEILCHHNFHFSARVSEDFILVDYNGLNDQITSSAQMQCRSNFRDNVIERDGSFCVITQEPASDCDAAHIIPRSKGHEVTFKIILCDSSMTYSSSTLKGLSKIVLVVMIPPRCLKFLVLMLLRMEYCWPRACIRSLVMETSPS